MRIGIWGAGNLGQGLAYRLVTTSIVSELFWANRNYDEIDRKIIDLEHGLAFAPTCHTVRGFKQEDVAIMLSQIDVLILTLGKRVPPGGTREDMYRENVAIFRELVIPALNGKFKGIVVVISNPVDLMARLVYLEAGLDSSRIIGLGTLVETARLKASLGAYLSPMRPAREVWAHAIGTHDANFIPVAHRGLAVGDATGEKELKELVRLAKGEVVKAADRVKTESGSSVHPIVEGSIKVIEAIAYDQRTILTVSVLDPDDGDKLFYSMPCCIGSKGVAMRHSNQWSGTETAIDACREQLRKILRDVNSK